MLCNTYIQSLCRNTVSGWLSVEVLVKGCFGTHQDEILHIWPNYIIQSRNSKCSNRYSQRVTYFYKETGHMFK